MSKLFNYYKNVAMPEDELTDRLVPLMESFIKELCQVDVRVFKSKPLPSNLNDGEVNITMEFSFPKLDKYVTAMIDDKISQKIKERLDPYSIKITSHLERD